MIRFDAIKEIVNALDDELVVCNIGVPSKELYQIKDRAENFYMLGSMGLVSSIGLGLALSRPDKKVIVIDGDGSLLMNLGSLATIGYHLQKLRNLILIVIDNGAYGSTGFQPTFTSKNIIDLEKIAIGCGFNSSTTITRQEQIVKTIKKAINSHRSWFILIKVDIGAPKTTTIPLTAIEIKNRFKKTVLE